MGIRSEIQGYMQAMKLGWNITDEMKAVILDRCEDVISNDPNSRSAIRAIECIVKMEESNIKLAESQSTKLSIKVSAPYDQMTSSQNDSIVENIVSGAIAPPSEEESSD